MASPEQMRKKSLAQDEAERHKRHAAVDGWINQGNAQGYNVSPAIDAAGRRVNAATSKERADIGKPDPSPNASIRFEE